MGKLDVFTDDDSDSKRVFHRPIHRSRPALIVALIATAMLALFAYRVKWVSSLNVASHGFLPCRYGDWSKPAEITQLASNTLLRSPDLVGGAGEMAYFIGTVSPARASPESPDSFASPLFSSDMHGISTGVPRGRFRFLRPLAARERSGRLHLFWGEPDSAAALTMAEREILPPKSIWHATYTPTKGWSEAERIYVQTRTDAALRWKADGVGIAIDSAGEVHVFISRIGMKPILHVMLERGEWRSQALPVRGLTADVAAGPRRRIYVTYIARGAPGRGPGNDVLMVKSDDAGRSWSRPMVISSLGYDRATGARVLIGASGVVHLLWGQNLSGGLFPQVVRHVASRDGGNRWSGPDDLQLPEGGLSNWNAVVDQCGSIHVAITSLVADKTGPNGNVTGRIQISYARWSGSWGKSTPLFEDYQPREADLAVTDLGTVLVVGSAARHDASGSQEETAIITSSLPRELNSGRLTFDGHR